MTITAPPHTTPAGLTLRIPLIPDTFGDALWLMPHDVELQCWSSYRGRALRFGVALVDATGTYRHDHHPEPLPGPHALLYELGDVFGKEADRDVTVLHARPEDVLNLAGTLCRIVDEDGRRLATLPRLVPLELADATSAGRLQECAGCERRIKPLTLADGRRVAVDQDWNVWCSPTTRHRPAQDLAPAPIEADAVCRHCLHPITLDGAGRFRSLYEEDRCAGNHDPLTEGHHRFALTESGRNLLSMLDQPEKE